MNDQPLLNWRPAATPEKRILPGRYVNLVPLDAVTHGDDLWAALQGPDSDPLLWDYLPYGPFPERAPFHAWLAGNAASADPMFFAVIDRVSGRRMEPVTTAQIYWGSVPFVIIQVIMVCLVILFPQMVMHYKGTLSTVDPSKVKIEIPQIEMPQLDLGIPNIK